MPAEGLLAVADDGVLRGKIQWVEMTPDVDIFRLGRDDATVVAGGDSTRT